jgi:hypothetical protein
MDGPLVLCPVPCSLSLRMRQRAPGGLQTLPYSGPAVDKPGARYEVYGPQESELP